MDYLAYAYLQRGRYAEAQQVVAAVQSMNDLPVSNFKVGYAANAILARFAVERRNWEGAAQLEPPPGSPPQFAAITYWARALGRARATVPGSPDADVDKLQVCLNELRATGDGYWATQVDVMLKEALAWRLAAKGETDAAIRGLRSAADEEDAVEKLPVTPGPIVPAREQLGELLLGLKHPDV